MSDATDRAPAEQPLTKSMFAYQALRRQILNGDLAPGERLLLRPLAEELGLSVMPVRDALRMLERDGLVRSESHRGSTVTPIASGAIVELIGIRMWLEVLAVNEAAARHTPETLAAVRERLDAAEAEAVHGEPLAYAQANRALHEAIEEPASTELRTMIDDTWERVWQARRRTSLFSLVPDIPAQAQREHRRIVAALVKADAEAAGAAMLAHRKSTLAAWQKALRDVTGGSRREAERA
jgi:DNA-binding GntR family transcriptional regulator